MVNSRSPLHWSVRLICKNEVRPACTAKHVDQMLTMVRVVNFCIKFEGDLGVFQDCHSFFVAKVYSVSIHIPQSFSLAA
jgi:hypothetical protein